jgi:hypothetical protein
MSVALAVDLLKAAQRKKHGGLALVSNVLGEGASPPLDALPLFWPELEQALPDGGLPRGVVELSAARALGGATRVALAAVRGGQGRSPGAWCAWVDPEGSLYAPGVARAEVDLQRLLVVRPPRKDLARVAVKLAQSQAFEVIVVDYSAPALVIAPATKAGALTSGLSSKRKRSTYRPEVLVRKLALLAEEGGSTVVFITDSNEPRPIPWPVALRLDLSRVPGALTVKVVKDRFCRLGASRVAWPARASAPSSLVGLVGLDAVAVESFAAAAE